MAPVDVYVVDTLAPFCVSAGSLDHWVLYSSTLACVAFFLVLPVSTVVLVAALGLLAILEVHPVA